jgi:hypothetical protein
MRLSVDDVAIRRYLLGELPEAETAALEEWYFGDPGALDQVRAVEHDLLDDYAAGRLVPAERGRFEAHYLASPQHRARLSAARALRLAGARPAAPQARRWAPAALAAALLLAALGLLWLLGRPVPSPSVAGTKPRDGSPGPSPTASRAATREPTLAAFALSPILVRGSEQRVLAIPGAADEVVLYLEGGEPRRATALVFDLRTVEGKPVAHGPALAVSSTAPRRALAEVHVPAASLPPEDYVLSLGPAGAGEDALIRYSFRVARR